MNIVNRVLGTTAMVIAITGALPGLLSGCKPDIGVPPSLIAAPQLLDVRATPAEAKPGADVVLDALVVDVDGVVSAPVAWTTCRTPKPPAESNAVSRACVDQPDDAPPVPGPTPVTLPADACSLFGPLTPPAQPGQPPIRPRDPDPTGGFYQPIRAAVRDLSDGSVDLLGFALVRVSCALANAPVDVARQFNNPDTGYQLNIAPVLESITAVDAGGTVAFVFGAGASPIPSTVHPGDSIPLRAAWTADSAETFMVFDVAARTLVSAREALRVSWFSTGGELSHDRTGRGSDEVDTFSDNTWKAPNVDGTTTIHFWVVLRDSRGGSDHATFDILVSP